jgi:hypothetical protein
MTAPCRSLRRLVTAMSSMRVTLGEQRRWNCKAKRLGSLDVDEQLEPRGLLHRQVRRLCASEDFGHVGCQPPTHLSEVWPIRNEATGFCVLPQAILH